jgi:hypothetical protein
MVGETVGPTRPQLSVKDVPTESRPVAPPADAPLAQVRRDCGISVALPAGGALWLYCDTATFGDEGRLAWFENTSAAVASAEEPLVMRERTNPQGHAAPFLEPSPDYPACAGDDGRFTWPTAAVLLDEPGPTGGEATDGTGDEAAGEDPGADTAGADTAGAETAERETDEAVVAVFYENVCLGAGGGDGQDAGIARFAVPTDPVPNGSLDGWSPTGFFTGQIVNERLFPRPPDDRDGDEHPFGQAAVRAGDHVYAYRCPNTYGACTVARTPATLDALSDRDAWQGWDGTGWTAALDASAPMDQPDAVRLVKPSIAWIEDLDLFVQAAHIWGKSHLVELRVSADPWGPWSEPVEVPLPGCTGRHPDVCFAVEIHPSLSRSGAIAITWYDPSFVIGGPSPTRYAEIQVTVRP